MTRALITGVNGQDGSYLVDLLLDKGYEVHGTLRRTSAEPGNLWRIDDTASKINVHYMDMTDALSVDTIIERVKPDLIFNMAGQSFVTASFTQPEVTFNINTLDYSHFVLVVLYQTVH